MIFFNIQHTLISGKIPGRFCDFRRKRTWREGPRAKIFSVKKQKNQNLFFERQQTKSEINKRLL